MTDKSIDSLQSLIIGLVIFSFSLLIFYTLVLDNFIIVMDAVPQIDDLRPVKDQIFWLMVGVAMLTSIKGTIAAYNYARRGKSISG